jgi:hypothetical protein
MYIPYCEGGRKKNKTKGLTLISSLHSNFPLIGAHYYEVLGGGLVGVGLGLTLGLGFPAVGDVSGPLGRNLKDPP